MTPRTRARAGSGPAPRAAIRSCRLAGARSGGRSSPGAIVRSASPPDRTAIEGMLARSFGSARVVSRGMLHDALTHPAVVVEEGGRVSGVAVYFHEADQTELLALVSEATGRGHGTRLVAEVLRRARRRGSRHLIVTTTDDNVDAVAFYGSRGFQVVERRRRAVDAYRRLKPEIPERGAGGRPIRDEIVLIREVGPSLRMRAHTRSRPQIERA